MREPIMKDGITHWKCGICKKVKTADNFYNNKLGHYQCKDCLRERSRERERGLRTKAMQEPPPQSDQDLLKSLQAFDSSWTMEKLIKAKTEPAAHVVKGGSHVSPKKLQSSRNNARMTRNKPYS